MGMATLDERRCEVTAMPIDEQHPVVAFCFLLRAPIEHLLNPSQRELIITPSRWAAAAKNLVFFDL